MRGRRPCAHDRVFGTHRLNTVRTVEACARLRPDTHGDTATAAAKTALHCLARRHQALTAEIARLDADLLALCEATNPALLAARGVGVLGAHGAPPAQPQR